MRAYNQDEGRTPEKNSRPLIFNKQFNIMKTIRVYLSVMAIVFSVGGAIASGLLVNPVFRFVDLPGTEDDRCDQISLECSTNFSFPCKVNATSPTLRSINSPSTSCGVELTRQTAPPQP